MRNFVRIESGRVAEVFDLDAHHPDRDGIDGLFHPSQDWRVAPPECAEGWVVHDGQIVPADYYQVLRAAEYPPLSEKADAEVKMASSDPVVQVAGQAQMNAYVNKCFAVKLKYPKS